MRSAFLGGVLSTHGATEQYFIVFMKGDGDHYLAYSNSVQGTTIHS